MMNEMKAQIFKKKVFGLKHKFRFVGESEVIQDGDLHFKVLGDGVYKFKTPEDLEDYLSVRPREILEGTNWEAKVLRWLVENSHQFAIGYKLILIARLLDNPGGTNLWTAKAIGEPVAEYPMRVFFRKV